MNNRYTVTITEQGNPEFVVTDERLHNGIEADGVLMVLFNREGEMVTEMVAGISNMEIAEYLSKDVGEAGSIIRQSVKIADGMREALRIHADHEKKKLRKRIDIHELLDSLAGGDDD